MNIKVKITKGPLSIIKASFTNKEAKHYIKEWDNYNHTQRLNTIDELMKYLRVSYNQWVDIGINKRKVMLCRYIKLKEGNKL